jgi:hypothetical protein
MRLLLPWFAESTLAATIFDTCARWHELTRMLLEVFLRCTTQSQADHREAEDLIERIEVALSVRRECPPRRQNVAIKQWVVLRTV